MAQVFSPSMNVLSRVSLLAAVAAPVLLMLIGSGITRSSANTKVQIALDQPVPFSHEHHINELGIDCRYCHTTVEKSAFAGIPPTHTCMSCHSQIWTNSPLLEPIRESYATGKPIRAADGSVGWNRVNKVPEFVYFNHSIHIARGVNCNFCHGPVQHMQLTYKGKPFFMAWCLECHNNPEKFLYRNKAEVAKGISAREQIFIFYRKASRGEHELTPREKAMAEGNGDKYTANADDTREREVSGEEVVKDLKVKKAQLADCWICHR
jgi:hypothetical protein